MYEVEPMVAETLRAAAKSLREMADYVDNGMPRRMVASGARIIAREATRRGMAMEADGFRAETCQALQACRAIAMLFDGVSKIILMADITDDLVAQSIRLMSEYMEPESFAEDRDATEDPRVDMLQAAVALQRGADIHV